MWAVYLLVGVLAAAEAQKPRRLAGEQPPRAPAKPGERTPVCSIPLLRVPVNPSAHIRNVLPPPAANLDRMPSVRLPAPPCGEPPEPRALPPRGP